MRVTVDRGLRGKNLRDRLLSEIGLQLSVDSMERLSALIGSRGSLQIRLALRRANLASV